MKINLFALLILGSALFNFSCSSSNKEPEGKKINFKVYGNCEMCKETIEGSLKNVQGINYANWDVEKKTMTVIYDSTKTNELAIHKKIAGAGYDTELETGDDIAYKGLHQCCQYDRKKQ
jgi:periplasmic mercuric ion binding protein